MHRKEGGDGEAEERKVVGGEKKMDLRHTSTISLQPLTNDNTPGGIKQ